MKIESIATTGASFPRQDNAAESVERDREASPFALEEPTQDENKVAAEEVLSKITELTEDGLYSVRFERDENSNDLVVRVVDSESGDVIRQLPPEEILGVNKRLEELRGLILKTQG